MWSLGCILVWLMIGGEAFSVGIKDTEAGKFEDVLEVVHMKHSAWVSLLPAAPHRIWFF